MDNLARNAMLARQAGMSYGKWKAMQTPTPIEQNGIPEGWKYCRWCGKAFKPKAGKQIYCEYDCREKAYYEKSREIRIVANAEYRRKRKEREKNGQA